MVNTSIKKRTIGFGKIDLLGRGRAVNPVTLNVELSRNSDGFPVFSASGEIWNSNKTKAISWGQMLDNVARVPENNALFQEIKGFWRKYHLNDLNAGTKAQEAALKKVGLTSASKYSEAVEYLKKKGLYEVQLTATEKKYNPRYANKPYRYGTGWLYRPIPAKDLARIEHILNDPLPVAKSKTATKKPTTKKRVTTAVPMTFGLMEQTKTVGRK